MPVDISTNRSVFLAGHRGMVGAALLRRLQAGHIGPILTRSRAELDLTDQAAVASFFDTHRPDHVYLAAAKVGGIYANETFPADFIHQNLMIEANVIGAAHRYGTERLLFLGSSCIYPRLCRQPMRESDLLSGPLEPTNEPYAIAKIAGIKLCESYNRQHGTDFRCVMPTNLYGPGDNFHPTNSHVVPALLRRFHQARLDGDHQVRVWGSGSPRREFLYVDDLARACIHVMTIDKRSYEATTARRCSYINVGSGTDGTIAELAAAVAEVVGFDGQLYFDRSKPDGAPRKLLDVSRIKHLGWTPQVGLKEGLRDTYAWFVANAAEARV